VTISINTKSYRLPKEEKPIFWEVLISAILSNSGYTSAHFQTVPEIERFLCTDEQNSDFRAAECKCKLCKPFDTGARNRVLSLSYQQFWNCAVSQKPFTIGHIHVHNVLLTMAEIEPSQNVDISSWETCALNDKNTKQ
jgi:hypothetical protein